MKKLKTVEERIERFLSRIEICLQTNCWNWVGALSGYSPHQYGSLSLRYEESKAHRYMYWLCYGDIPKGKVICHACDNCRCVNPSHLFIGTQSDNMLDMFSKNRVSRAGERNGRAKLTQAQVARIRKTYSQKKSSYESLAQDYLVSKSTIAMIIQGKVW